ncbi:MAG TPA: protease inhibitor I42 family protein [Kiritimatiellia bacterium]|nr:protease inhibitor I42 family protein [Kiritimatiellia bacterium]HRZ12601.1 protease inhibitor I42 family protein [Kiritimatiellia bacterium]HSA17679.1 protease inhibitor I42 family protein [Kiritimatiellia bacterium]
MPARILRTVLTACLPALLLSEGSARAEDPPATVTASFTAEGGEQSVTLAPGQALEVRLPGNPTTGYGWTVEAFEAQEILGGPADVEYTPQAPDRMGAGGVFTFRFSAAKAGSTTLRFVYRRSWEKDEPALHTAALNVTVE